MAAGAPVASGVEARRFRPWMFASAVWIVPAAFAMLGTVVPAWLRGESAPSLHDIIWNGGDWLVYGAIAPFVFAAASRWPIVRPNVWPRVALHAALSTLASIAWATGGKALDYGLQWMLTPGALHDRIATGGGHFLSFAAHDLYGWILVTLPYGAIVYVFIGALAQAMRYVTIAHERELAMARLAEQLAGARLAALRAQLNPDMLFKALSDIAARARGGDGSGAARLVEQLSELLRTALRATHPIEGSDRGA